MDLRFSLIEDEAKQYLNENIQAEILSNNCQFTEGPVWNEEGYYLFSDTTANCMYKIVPGQQKELFINQSGTENTTDENLNGGQAGSNGLAYDTSGNLLVCRHGSHSIARWQNGQLQNFIHTYQGKPFNSPNDLVVHTDGRVFFSDPPYGLKDGKSNSKLFQPEAGVYCWNEDSLTLITNKYQYPNGVCLGPDGKELFICSNKPFERFISVFDAHTLAHKRILAEENSDGLKCDENGNLYLATKEGLVVLNAKGKRLLVLPLPAVPANLCFGGPHKKDLFVTARQYIFLLRDFLK